MEAINNIFHQTFQELIDRAPLAIIMFDPENRVLLWNADKKNFMDGNLMKLLDNSPLLFRKISANHTRSFVNAS